MLLSTAAVLSLGAATEGGLPWAGATGSEQALRQWVEAWTVTTVTDVQTEGARSQPPALIVARPPVIAVLEATTEAPIRLVVRVPVRPLLPQLSHLPPPTA